MRNYPLVKNRKKRKAGLIITLITCIVAIASIIIAPIAVVVEKKKTFERQLKNISIEIPTSLNLYKGDKIQINPNITNVPKGWEQNFKYQWVQSDDGLTWTPIPNETNKNLNIPSNKAEAFRNKKVKLIINYDNKANIQSIISDINISSSYRKIDVSIPENLNASEQMSFSVTPSILGLPQNYDKSKLKYQWYISNEKQNSNNPNGQNLTYIKIPGANSEVFECQSNIELNDKMIKLEVSGENIESCFSNPGYIRFRKISDIFVNKIQFWSGTSKTDFFPLVSPVVDRWSNNFFEIQTMSSQMIGIDPNNNQPIWKDYTYACVQLPYSVQDFELKDYGLPIDTKITWSLLENQRSFEIIQNANKYYLINKYPLYSSDIKTKVRASLKSKDNKEINIDVKFSFYTGTKNFLPKDRLYKTINKKAVYNQYWKILYGERKYGNFYPISEDQIYIKGNYLRINLKEKQRHARITLPTNLIQEYFVGINPELNGKNLKIQTPNGVPGWTINKIDSPEYIEMWNQTTMTQGPNIFTLPMSCEINGKIYRQELLVNFFVSPY